MPHRTCMCATTASLHCQQHAAHPVPLVSSMCQVYVKHSMCISFCFCLEQRISIKKRCLLLEKPRATHFLLFCRRSPLVLSIRNCAINFWLPLVEPKPRITWSACTTSPRTPLVHATYVRKALFCCNLVLKWIYVHVINSLLMLMAVCRTPSVNWSLRRAFTRIQGFLGSR